MTHLAPSLSLPNPENAPPASLGAAEIASRLRAAKVPLGTAPADPFEVIS